MLKQLFMKKKAFSLIELLISLITISVILAAMTPIVTHKLKYSGISIGQGGSVTNKCEKFSSDCQLCTNNKCLICTKNCSNNQYLDKDNCVCKSCPNNCESCSQSGCNKCQAGYEKTGNSCTPCASGFYSNSGGSCQKCPKGTRTNANSAATGCINCDGANQYQDLEGQTTCKTCNPGFVHNNHKSCTNCSPGTYWNGSSCQSCSAGSYSNANNAVNCTQCGIGTYQDETGKTSCKFCNGVNQYQDGLGQTSCKTCGENSTPNSGHSGCESLCDGNHWTTAPCKPYQAFDGCHCYDCPLGEGPRAVTDRAASWCQRCVEENCAQCEKPSVNQVCSRCKDGYYLSNDRFSCYPCPPGCKKCNNYFECTECLDDDLELKDNRCIAKCDKIKEGSKFVTGEDPNSYITTPGYPSSHKQVAFCTYEVVEKSYYDPAVVNSPVIKEGAKYYYSETEAKRLCQELNETNPSSSGKYKWDLLTETQYRMIGWANKSIYESHHKIGDVDDICLYAYYSSFYWHERATGGVSFCEPNFRPTLKLLQCTLYASVMCTMTIY